MINMRSFDFKQVQLTLRVKISRLVVAALLGSFLLPIGGITATHILPNADAADITYNVKYYENPCYEKTGTTGCGDTPKLSSTDTCISGSTYTIGGSSKNSQSTPTTSRYTGNATPYTFAAWSTFANGNNLHFVSGQSYYCSADLNLYVQWSNYQLNFSTGAGGPTVASLPVDPALYLSLIHISEPTRPY